MDNFIIFIGKDLEGAVPAEIQVIPFGYFDTPKGPFELTAAGAGEVIAAFEAQKNDMVIDYEHQTLADPPVPAPAAGWIKKLVNKGAEGIWAVMEWTEKARQYIANREYKYVSPVFLKRKSDNRVVRLINVALTNQPNIDGMVPLVNKGMIADFGPRNENKEEIMDKELLKLLGLPETATMQDVTTAINKLQTEIQTNKDKTVAVVANKAVLDALGLTEGATEAEVTGTITAMKQGSSQVTDLAKQVAVLTNKLSERDAGDIVTQAMKDGKITPAQKEWAEDYAKRDLEGFRVFVAKAPVVVVQGKIITDRKPPEGAIDDTQAQINKLCGVDDKTFKEFGPKEQG